MCRSASAHSQASGSLSGRSSLDVVRKPLVQLFNFNNNDNYLLLALEPLERVPIGYANH